VTVTGSPGTGDDDPVAQFSDPELRHAYAEYPTGAFPPVPVGPSAPAGGILTPRRSSRRRLLALLIIVVILGVAAGLVASFAH
jgi:hypothetical protein